MTAPVRVLIVTQEEPFYLPSLLPRFLDELSERHDVVGAVVLSPSPYGKASESFLRKMKTVLTIFGLRFFFYYGMRYLHSMVHGERVSSVISGRRIPLISLEHSINHKESLQLIADANPELTVSILANEVFKEEFLKIAPCLNLHSAPLPRYRGLMPSFWVMCKGEKETAVSVFLVDSGIDSGPIYVQRRFSIEGLSLAELVLTSKEVGLSAMLDAIQLVEEGSKPLIANPDDESTYFGFPTRTDVLEFRRRGCRFF